MIRVISKQVYVPFIFLPSPCRIDKEWGVQQFPDGAFLKVVQKEGQPDTISHGVQPNADKNAPIGWHHNLLNLYSKNPIWVDENMLPMEKTVEVNTKDGVINYDVGTKQCFKCYNGTEDSPDWEDGWVQTLEELQKNYHLPEWFTSNGEVNM